MNTAASSTAGALDSALATVSEFPERLGPVLIKELRQGLRSGLFVLPFVILPAVLALVAVWALSIDSLGDARNGVQGCYWTAIVVPVLFITPLRALGTIRSEREAQTLDLLQLTPLSAWRIVVAKWSSLQAQSLLWVAALMPFLVLRYFFGAMNLTDQLLVLLWIVVAGGVLTACGLVVSTMPRLVFWLSLAGMVFFGLIGLVMMLGTLFSPRGFGRIFGGGGSTPSLSVHALLLLMSAHVTYLALAFAGSRIAPLADNYALRLRGGTLALFAWYGLAVLLLPAPDQNAAMMFFLAAGIATTIFTAIDLTTSRAPLLTHVRPFARFGPLGAIVGRAFLPGWPGALVFFSAMTVLAGVIAFFAAPGGDQEEFFVRALIFWPAVVLPRALQCFFMPRSGDRPALHLALHLSGPLLAGIIAMFSFAIGNAIFVPAALVPSAMWWLATFEGFRVDDHFVTVAITGALWILGLATVFYYHARDYWTVVARHVAIVRDKRPTSPPREPAR